MVRAWYFVDYQDDQRLPHQTDPPQFVGLDKLEELGVLYFEVDADKVEEEGKLQKIKKDRKYTYEDHLICSPDKLDNYEEKIKAFFQEHLHADEEIRYITDGSGYFDVRDENERWIRVEVVKNDLLILPAGIYHRFTLDTKNYIEARRFFVGEPVWTPHNRPCEDHPARKQYLQTKRRA